MKDMNVGQSILSNRKRIGYTQSDVAAFLNISKAAVSKWEKGHSLPEINYLARLAVLFDITLDELVNYSPQLSRQQIRTLYHKLAGMFETDDYDDALEAVRNHAHRYYSCYRFLTVLTGLLLNHAYLKEDKTETFELAKQLISRVLLNSDSLHFKEQVTFFRAMIHLMEQQPSEAVDLLEDAALPKLPASTLLAQSYQMQGGNQKAKAVLQIEVYQNIVFIIGDLTMMIKSGLYDDLENLISRGETMDAAFNLKALHPNSMLNFHLVSAMQLVGDKKQCFHHLEAFLESVENLISDYYLHGDEFFTEIDEWVADFDIGKDVPVNFGIAKEQLANALVDNPAFSELKEDIAFKNIVHKLKKIVEEN
ncbi:helix-turn-helix domain-containing protein [Salinicoccus hispanicus]|uniref:Helix-turn-helix domain-containing protein n=1 Tax=Salinicoccus hispanicus TaxID=157225 RepID=A0A6N8U2Q8_9STAP|nr:helix-turn-helix transcriptional regulator [Salinicoccus hispanicus]MXQ51276.1 helix-turn-helix domain-containing protein [Salinicoccus hispanicus]